MIDRAAEVILGGLIFAIGVSAFFSAIKKTDRYKSRHSAIGIFTIETPK